MNRSSLLGGEHAPEQSPGRDVDALGPSDSSDSGSDVQGELALATPDELDFTGGAITALSDSDTDAEGTGERASAVDDGTELDADILPDRIFEPDATGLLDDGADLVGPDGADRLDGQNRDVERVDSARVDSLAADPVDDEDDDDDDDEDAVPDDAADRR